MCLYLLVNIFLINGSPLRCLFQQSPTNVVCSITFKVVADGIHLYPIVSEAVSTTKVIFQHPHLTSLSLEQSPSKYYVFKQSPTTSRVEQPLEESPTKYICPTAFKAAKMSCIQLSLKQSPTINKSLSNYLQSSQLQTQVSATKSIVKLHALNKDVTNKSHLSNCV